MSKDKKHNLAIVAYILLALSFLSECYACILFGNITPGFFPILFLTLAGLEIILRISIGKKKGRGWRYWATWICRWSGGLMLLLSAIYLLRGGAFWDLTILVVIGDVDRVLQAVISLRGLFFLCGLVIVLSRIGLRKKAILITFGLFMVSFLLMVAAMDSGTENENAVFAPILLLPFMYGLWGAIADPLIGDKLDAEETLKREKEREATLAKMREKVEKNGQREKATAAVAAAATDRPEPVQDPAVEEMLKKQKNEYEARMRKAAESHEDVHDSPAAEEMLPIVSDRLFNEGETASSLSGQRQLAYWLAQSVTCPEEMFDLQSAHEFFNPSLKDDPEIIKLARDAFLFEVSSMISGDKAKNEERQWARRKPEALCAAWYALKQFSAAGINSGAFTRAASRLAAFFDKDRSCREWLAASYTSMEEGRNQ